MDVVLLLWLLLLLRLLLWQQGRRGTLRVGLQLQLHLRL
jgi:hypothetical protein